MVKRSRHSVTIDFNSGENFGEDKINHFGNSKYAVENPESSRNKKGKQMDKIEREERTMVEGVPHKTVSTKYQKSNPFGKFVGFFVVCYRRQTGEDEKNGN